MKNMTTLGKVSERVDALSKNCHDKLIPVPEISFDGLESVNISNEPHLLRPLAQQSIAWRLGIPINYLRKCPPEMQAYNMNHWIKEEKNEQLFFRFDQQDVRAIFTPATSRLTISKSWRDWIPSAINLIPGSSAIWMRSSCRSASWMEIRASH